ncbi:MAG: hypothetical protein MK135_01125 [Polyangiaceae bacterium]|nr:hypothetical protein [Polyangiaceae bacterium]
MLQLFFEPKSVGDLLGRFEREFRLGRAILPAESEEGWIHGASCQVVIVHPQTREWFPLEARVIKVSPWGARRAVVVELSGQASALEHLKAFIEDPASTPSTRPPPARRSTASSPLVQDSVDAQAAPLERNSDADALDDGATDDAVADDAVADDARPEDQSQKPEADDEESSFELELVEPAPAAAEEEEAEKAPDARDAKPAPLNIQMRVRQLKASEREKLARTGALHERVALERAFGPTVWEALLNNSSITGQEVARIAKNRTVPTPLLQVIVNHSAWLGRGEVRRALLSNTKLAAASIDKVLRALPRMELKQVSQQTAYPARVRQAAARMVNN